ncbi:MAG: AMP-binding protein [Anaerolineaceae bacterium]|nr:AMP-binding protein [Anaerolineaceae bacterium]
MPENNNIGYLCTAYQCEQGRAEKTAFRWVDPDFRRTDVSFEYLDWESNRYANALEAIGYGKGDRIFLYLPAIPEVYFSFLGILKMQAVAGLLFSNFGKSAIYDRLADAEAKVIITKKSLLRRVRDVMNDLPSLETVLVVDLKDDEDEKIRSFPALLRGKGASYTVAPTDPQTPSVLHYTSGSTGKPKGVLHVHGSLEHQRKTVQDVLQLEEDDVYWCTADHGWVTGTTYGLYGPWCLGHTQVHFGGTFKTESWFKLLEQEKITVWYTAPTALRMLMREEAKIKGQYDLSSLKRIYSVGEPLNAEIIHWFRRTLGKEIYDTWFQTETGGHMIVNRPGLPIKPGSMGKSVEGTAAVIAVDDKVCETPDTVGSLWLKKGWPAMFVEYLNLPEGYDAKFHGEYYDTGDLAKVDEDGYFWFVGRNDDVINPSGHLVGPFEVESALLEIPEIVDVAVIGAPDPMMYEKIVAFVTLKEGTEWSRKIELKCRIHISNRLSPIAVPSEYYQRDKLPKNRSGKIMRRVLKAEYLGEDLGDVSTMEV